MMSSFLSQMVANLLIAGAAMGSNKSFRSNQRLAQRLKKSIGNVTQFSKNVKRYATMLNIAVGV